MSQPNLIFFLTDQQHFRTLQANGCPEAQTPNLDRLAREGLNFQNHFVTNPVCAPSRGSIWTGRYPSENGLYGNGCSLPETETTLPMALKQAGYATAHFGKLHLEPTMTHGLSHRNYGFDTCRLAEGDQWFTHDDYNLWLRENHPKAYFEFYHQMANEGHGKAYRSTLPEELSLSHWVTEKGINWLEQQGRDGEPSFLSLGYFDPHHAWNPCEPYASEFAYRQVSSPVFASEDLSKKPKHWEAVDLIADPFALSSIIRSYHAMIMHLDACLGRLFDALERFGQLDNTIIVFSSDHGEFLGNHSRLFKGPFLCDDLLQTPLIIWDGAQRNTVKGNVSKVTSSLDFFPTFLALAGQNGLSDRPGIPILDQNMQIFPQGEREFAISEWRMHPHTGKATDDILSIRTEDRRYVQYSATGEEEYYEHASDPFETNNRASDRTTADARAELAEMLIENAPARGNWPTPTAPW